MAAQDLEYKGARLQVRHHGGGWKVFIYLPGSNMAETTIPNTREPGGHADVIAQAKAVVDAALG